MFLSGYRERFEQWLHQRIPPKDQVFLTQSNVYILPTGAGFMMVVTLLVLLVASINYQLNLGYLLTFMLASNVMTSVYVCHGTLRGLRMRLSAPMRGFAMDPHAIHITLVNERQGPRYNIQLAVLPLPPEKEASEVWTPTDIPGRTQIDIQLQFTPRHRGWQSLPLLTAETRYPLGVFRVWTVWRAATKILVYPRPEIQPPPWPAATHQEAGDESGRAVLADNPDGVRGYRQGDSMRSLVWRSTARSDNPDHWASRDHAGAREAPLCFDWMTLQELDTESRVSRLTAWVRRAEQLGHTYALRLPGKELAAACGQAHEQACLEALALC